MEKHFMDSSAPPSYGEVQAGFVHPGFRQPPESMPMGPSFEHQQSTMHPQHNRYPVQPQAPYPVRAVQVSMQQQPATTATFIVNSSPLNVGPHPQQIVCPKCGENIKTKCIAETNATTHFAAFILCAMGCFLCSCIPYCMDSCKNRDHYCPSCNEYLGTYGPVPTQRASGRYYR